VVAYLLLRLLQQVKSGQDLAVAFRDAIQNPPRDVLVLLLNRLLFRVSIEIDHRSARFDPHLLAPRMHCLVDMPGHLPPDHRSDETHQPLRLPEFSLAHGLHDDQERVMNLILQVLRSQLAAQVETDAPGEHPI